MKPIRRRFLGVEIEAHPVVFTAGAGLIILFVVLAALWPHRSLMTFNLVKDWIAAYFSWLYVGSMTGFLCFALWLAFSRYGRIRLGRDDESPEFSRLSWFAMLFSAGMGIGLLFFGVAEPMFHLMNPPDGGAGTPEAARQAMGITLFHWCLHPWALYAVVALALAYASFRRGHPLTFRSVLYPILGERVHGRIGHLVDVMALLATLFGLATSLGLGAKQVNAGLGQVFGLQQGTGIQMLLIAGITMAAVASLVSGLHRGIRRLSEINLVLAGSLCVFLIVVGPTFELMKALPDNVAAYAGEFVRRSFWTGLFEDESSKRWLGGWTVFYWGWWIAWSPFVGMFIARISRGRTIREFIGGVLLVPSALGLVWFTVLGGSAISQENALQMGVSPPVQPWGVLASDPESGLSLTEDGRLVAFDTAGVASTSGILVESKGGQDMVSAAAQVPLAYRNGVLARLADGSPYSPLPEEVFGGHFRAEMRELTLGGYLTQPVLSESRDQLQDTTSTALFVLLQAYPLSWLLALIATLSVVLFFITSSDSASFVADMISSGGSRNPTTGTRLFWGILEGVLAAVLLMAGGLTALQTGSIALGLPLTLVILLLCFSLVRSLRQERQ